MCKGLSEIHIKDVWICMFRKLQPSSSKGLITGIQFHPHYLDPSTNSLLKYQSIHLLLNGLNREKRQSKDIRLPLTLPLLHKLIAQLKAGCFSLYSDLLLETASLTAFYGPLRGGKFTSHTDAFDPSHDLTKANVKISSHYFSIFLKHSKTDGARRGTSILISDTDSAFCPRSSMRHYLRSRPRAGQNEPLFAMEVGMPISRAWFPSHLCLLWQYCGLPPDHYSAHSLCIGAGTTASSITSVSTLKASGRWSSAAYERHLRPEAQAILDVQKAMRAL